jgi:hypothetical protein
MSGVTADKAIAYWSASNSVQHNVDLAWRTPCGRREHVFGERGRYIYLHSRISRLNDLGVEMSIILQWIFKKYDVYGGASWIALAKDKDKLRAFVNTVMIP